MNMCILNQASKQANNMSSKLAMKKRVQPTAQLAVKVKKESVCTCRNCKPHNFHHGPDCCFLAGQSFLVSQKLELCKPEMCSFSCEIHAHRTWKREISLKTLLSNITFGFDKDHIYMIDLLAEYAKRDSMAKIDGLCVPNWAVRNLKPELCSQALSLLVSQGFNFDIFDSKVMELIAKRVREDNVDMWFTVPLRANADVAIAFANEFVLQGSKGKLDLGLRNRVKPCEVVTQKDGEEREEKIKIEQQEQ
jgi:hypothetical protein